MVKKYAQLTVTFMVSFLGLLSLTGSVFAYEKMRGCLIATQNCEAFRSIKKRTNPGHIRLEPGISYRLKGKNKQSPTHYQVRIDALKTPNRWVAISCGKVVEDCAVQNKEEGKASKAGKYGYGSKKGRYKGKGTRKAKGNGHYLLAVSWEPAFCESHRNKAECKIMTAQSIDAKNLSLHGLWPQPRNNAYCNVSVAQKSLDRARRWNSLDKLKLNPATMESLKKVMPGVLSNLQRHEWVKHGSCYKDGSAEVYYQHSIDLMNKLNATAVQTLFFENIGKYVSASQIKATFDKAFGAGAGRKVNVRCDRKRKYISELWINLQGDIHQGATLGELMKNAKPARNSCDGGLIDAAGYK